LFNAMMVLSTRQVGHERNLSHEMLISDVWLFYRVDAQEGKKLAEVIEESI